MLHHTSQTSEPRRSSKMCPHRIDLLPSSTALSSYNISKNGFLPAEQPLKCLPHNYYQSWERIVAELPYLIEHQLVRERVDRLPILSTSFLDSESEWQRVYSMLALIAQGYIWSGPEPSEVSQEH
jgi:indoleamine 2,3-dioxygenase